jgi:DNA (cytosine-5)-methyltransferase 1
MSTHKKNAQTGKSKPKKVREHSPEYSQPAPQTAPFRFIDLFCGVGGFRIGFERAGCECVFSCDWNKFAQETYAANFGETPIGDIYAVSSSEIPAHDILCAGFPCQPFSIAGVSKKNALGEAHGFAEKKQGNLFFELARIIRDRRPKAFLLENVKNLRHHDRGRTYEIIMSTLKDDLGYHVYDATLDAKLVLPHHRERIFIVGFDRPVNFHFPFIERKNTKVADILEPKPAPKYTLTDHLWGYLQAYAAKHKAAGNGFGFGLVDLNGVTRTLSARYYKDGAEILIPQKRKNPRRLTPRECARLLGFPDSFKIPVSDTQAYKQFGNSVAVPIVEILAHEIVRHLCNLTGSPERFRRLKQPELIPA